MTHLFAVYGRFQPFTKAHENIVNYAYRHMVSTSIDEVPIVVGLSETTGDKDNPLTVEQRIEFIRESVSYDIPLTFVPAKDPWIFLKKLNEQFKEKSLVLFCGDDQYKDYTRMSGYNRHPNQFLFDDIHILNMGTRTEDGVSASRVRKAVKEHNIEEYNSLLSPALKMSKRIELLKLLDQSMRKHQGLTGVKWEPDGQITARYPD